MQDNLAGLAEGGSELWARWQQLSVELGPEAIGQGALTMRWAFKPGMGLGLLWQHQASPQLARDRLRLGLGVDLERTAGIPGLRLGLGLDRLRQAFSLDEAFLYGGLPQRDDQAFDASAGLLWRPWPWLALGLSGEQLARPNLGIWGADIFEPVLHWGAALSSPRGRLGGLDLLVSQDSLDGRVESRAGLQWRSPGEALQLRGGISEQRGDAGLGLRYGPWRLDYVYRFGLSPEASAFGASHGVDLGFELGPAPKPAPTPSPSVTPVELPPPDVAPSPSPTPDPVDAALSRALGLWQDGKRRQALKALDQALQGREDRPAESALSRAWRLALATPTPRPTPGPEAARLLREAEVYRLQGREDLAQKALQRVLEIEPGQAEARAALKPAKTPTTKKARQRSKERFAEGLRLHAEGDTPAARRAWEDALELDPENIPALNSLTRLRMQSGAKP
jgi:tetratricopeptide (TPR) repeat protein